MVSYNNFPMVSYNNFPIMVSYNDIRLLVHGLGQEGPARALIGMPKYPFYGNVVTEVPAGRVQGWESVC